MHMNDRRDVQSLDLDKIAIISSLAIIFALIIVRAATSALTFDEAYSLYVYAFNARAFATPNLANNHPLNSILMHFATVIGGDDEVVTRLPSIAMSVPYLYATYRLVQRVRCKYFSLALCVLNGILIEYFSMARGYAISASLVQFGLVEYYFVKKDERSYVVMLSSLALSMYSLFPTLVFYASVILAENTHRCVANAGGIRNVFSFLRTGDNGRRLWRGIGFWMLFTIWPLFGMYMISKPGKPLFGSSGDFFHAVIVSFVEMYLPSQVSVAVAVAACLAIVIACGRLRRHLSARTVVLGTSLIVTFLIIYASSRIGKRPLPSDRTLLEFVPAATLSLISLLEDVVQTLPARVSAGIQRGTEILALGLLWAFVSQYDGHTYRSNPESKEFRRIIADTVLYNKCIPPQIMVNLATEYYLSRYFSQHREHYTTCAEDPGSP